MPHRFFLFILFFLVATPAFACRCKQQRIEQYFHNAAIVFLGTAESVSKEGELSFSPNGAAFKGSLKEVHSITTATNSASCGITVEKKTPYLFFLQKSQKTGRFLVNTCNGTRVYDQHTAYFDIQGAQILKMLTVLRNQEVLAATGIRAKPKANSVVGFLMPHRSIPPTVSQQHSPADRTLNDTLQFKKKEIYYEQEALNVYEQKEDKLRLQLQNEKYVWVQKTVGKFIPISNVLVRRLGYFTSNFTGPVFPQPGAGHPIFLTKQKQKRSISIEKTQTIAESLWVQINVFKNDPCAGGSNEFSLSGWVPLYTSSGELSVWFWPRGC